MRGTSPRQPYVKRCVAMLLLMQVRRIPTAAEVMGSSSGVEPWLKARMLEIPVTVPLSTSAGSGLIPTERHHQNIDFTVRFDALLVAPEEAVRRIREAMTMALNSSGSNETSPGHDWRGWGREDDEAIAVAVEEALRHAGDSVYDEIGEEIVAAAAKDVDGDWLEAADATCNTVVLRRRREILEVYRHGWLDSQSIVCPEATKDCPDCPEVVRCRHGVTAEAAARLGTGWEQLADSAASLVACRVFFDLSEMEYAKAACLRAARLGNLSIDDAVEVDRRLAAVAFNHGRPSAAVQLYFRVMSLSSTTDDGRLAAAVTGLSMVPPAVIGSLRAMDEFRASWARDLRILRENIIAGVTKGRLMDPYGQVGTTPFHLAHQGGPDLDLMSSLAGVYDAAAPSLRYTSPHCRKEEDAKESSREDELLRRPIRIGFFSSYLRDHSIGRMMGLLITTLADTSYLEVHVFGPDDGGGSGIEAREATGGDPVIEALRSTVDYWHQAPQELDKARRVVAREELDVLVYPDVGMEPLTYLMAFARLAPVQCVWWGHPVTPSTGAIDYFLSLDAEAEEGQLDYLEQMVRMDVINTAPFTQVGSSPAKQGPPSEPYVDSDVASLPPTSAHYGQGLKPVVTAAAATVKVNEAAANNKDPTALAVKHEELLAGGSEALCLRTYLVLGRLFKLHPDFDVAIAGILARDPSGCVVLIHETRDEEWTRTVWSRLRETLLPQGLFRRLRIMHHWLYPDALRRADAILDTFPYGGCLTVLEGLSNGVPVVTLPADFVRGRFALAMYKQMGYTDLVAEDVEEYVSLAVRLGTEEAFAKQALARVEEGYRESLHKNEQSAREWGEFFVRACRAARFNSVQQYPPPGQTA